MYTSGSTGNPKGVMVTHANLSSWIENMNKIYKMEIGFKASQTYDLSFDLSVADIFFTWVNGGVLCVLPEEEHLMPFEYIKREQIEVWSSVPTQIRFLNKMGLLTKNVFPDLKYSIFCGEPLPKYLADCWRLAAPNSTVENLYGPTEATIWLTRYNYTVDKMSKSFKNNILPIGVCFEDHRIEIVDENEKIVSNNQVGEIVYKGPQLSEGYLNDTEKTRLSFKPFSWDPSNEVWYKSGDLGFYNNDGILECIGRKDNQIKMGGRRIEICEIESILRTF
jgi:non-ribosomal peptide synthetase component F